MIFNEMHMKIFFNVAWLIVGGISFYIYFSGFIIFHAFSPIPPSKFLFSTLFKNYCPAVIYEMSDGCRYLNFVSIISHELFHYLFFIGIIIFLFIFIFRFFGFKLIEKNCIWFSGGGLLVWFFIFFWVSFDNFDLEVLYFVFLFADIVKLILYVWGIFFIKKRVDRFFQIGNGSRSQI